MSDAAFTPALGRAHLDDYDRAIRIWTRESVWRGALLRQVAPRSGETILDVGCGTGSFAVMLKQAAPGARVFLAALGVSVIGMAVWRAFNAEPPEADLMGGIGIAALAVNTVAALVLARFREGGDAQARAIWLFSRNDALANIAVIAAAGLVWWLDSAWPDIVVAGAVAILFLRSAWEIVSDARRELAEAAEARS